MKFLRCYLTDGSKSFVAVTKSENKRVLEAAKPILTSD